MLPSCLKCVLRQVKTWNLHPESTRHWQCWRWRQHMMGQGRKSSLKALSRNCNRSGAGVRYAKIAAHAQALGRPRLATLLLEHETRAGEQVSAT
jgi:hypothetical protein